MSKLVKKFIMRDYESRLGDCENALVISVRGITANDTNRMRVGLQKQNIRITVVRNNLARKSIEGRSLEGLKGLLSGPSALAYGGDSVVEVAREVMKWAGQLEKLELKGAILDGEVFEGKAGVERLSKFPTRDEAIAQTVTLILSPARNVMGAVKGPGGRVLGVVKTVQEKLEKGEAISKVG